MPKPLTSFHVPREAVIWALALVVLAVLPPGFNDHVSLCVPSLLGMDWCLGCGVGESIGLFLRGDVSGSFAAHPIGPIAVGVLIGRIVKLVFFPNIIR